MDSIFNVKTITLRNLPSPFQGKTVALLTDIHHGPLVSLDYVRRVVEMTNEFKPDAILMAGDYVHKHHKYIEPCFDMLGNLHAPLGVFCRYGQS